jgi:hypothetical protein
MEDDGCLSCCGVTCNPRAVLGHLGSLYSVTFGVVVAAPHEAVVTCVRVTAG